MKAMIKALDYFVPEGVLTNAQLAAEFPEWTAERIEKKLGIVERHIAGPDDCASDLGVAAAKKLFEGGACAPGDIDYLLFCTQSPDYFLPTTACLVQDRLGIPKSAGALDFNLGCSAFVYGLGLAKGLVETEQAKRVLLITAETYSKFMHPKDKGVRTLFGDGAAATLVVGRPDGAGPGGLGPFVYGTDGSGGGALCVRSGGLRSREGAEHMTAGHPFPDRALFMDGGAIFNFTLKVVPESLNALLERSGLGMNDVDLFVFHQANGYMLEFLQKKCNIPDDKFYLCMKPFGNTVSSTIPIALRHAWREGKLKPGSRAMIIGFGVGLSWASGLIEWAV
jgi:3-oxoacyl-[acyl-carrier-protein] synthase-3